MNLNNLKNEIAAVVNTLNRVTVKGSENLLNLGLSINKLVEIGQQVEMEMQNQQKIEEAEKAEITEALPN